MDQRDAQIFESLHKDILARLVEVRGSIDHAYGEFPEDEVYKHFDLVLSKMQSFMATADAVAYRRFARQYVAMQVGEGIAYDNLIHALVAIGDVTVQIARAKLPDPEREEFVRDIMHLSFESTRMLVDLLAEDFTVRAAQRDRLMRGDL